MLDAQKLLAVLISITAVCCAETAQVEVKLAPSYAPRPAAVSVLGVFRDGRMSPESWAPIGATLSRALGSPACAIGFSDELAQEQPELFAKIDDEVRAEGITEELLARLAPRAEGDLILTVSLHGRAALPATEGEAPAQTRSRRPPRAGVQRRARAIPPGGRGLTLVASFYSVQKRASVAKVSARVEGANVDEALRKLAAEVQRAVPGASCRGWAWGSPAAPAATQ